MKCLSFSKGRNRFVDFPNSIFAGSITPLCIENLTDKGLAFRSGLVNRGLVVLKEVIESMKQQNDTTTQKLTKGDENEKITELIMEFSEECSGMIDNHTLQEQQILCNFFLQPI